MPAAPGPGLGRRSALRHSRALPRQPRSVISRLTSNRGAASAQNIPSTLATRLHSRTTLLDTGLRMPDRPEQAAERRHRDRPHTLAPNRCLAGETARNWSRTRSPASSSRAAVLSSSVREGSPVSSGCGAVRCAGRRQARSASLSTSHSRTAASRKAYRTAVGAELRTPAQGRPHGPGQVGTSRKPAPQPCTSLPPSSDPAPRRIGRDGGRGKNKGPLPARQGRPLPHSTRRRPGSRRSPAASRKADSTAATDTAPHAAAAVRPRPAR